MKTIFLSAMLVLALFAPGCSSVDNNAKVQKPSPIVTPDLTSAAKVVAVNEVGRFVVLNFPVGKTPKDQQTMFIYRAGLKVAEVKVSGSVAAGTADPENGNIVADLVTGDPKVGDSVRTN